MDAPQSSLGGIWYNQYQSLLKLRVQKSGRVTGTFETIMDPQGSQGRFPLTGFASSDHICFTVNFGRDGLLTSWVAQLTKEVLTERPLLISFWHSTTNLGVADEPKMFATLNGLDVFQRTPPGPGLLGRI